MVRLSSVFRLAAKASTGSESIFAKAIVRAAAKPRPPSPPAFTPQQTVTPTLPQWNGGTAFQPINTSHTPMVGYGVYSPEYLQQMELNSEPPVYGPTVPESFDSPSFEPLNFDPLNRNDVFLPVDNVAEQEPVIDEESAEQAQGLADEIAEGKGLDLVGDDELNREDVVERLETGGYEVESAEWGLAGDNVTRTTITDPGTGETIHEYYDHDTDRYWIEVTGEDGETLSQSPVRDDEGRKVTVSEDEESGERTTRLEDDLGDGSVVEITELTGSDGVTITTTDSDGNSETVVVAEDGTRTTLDPEQDTSREGVDEIVDGVANGQSIEEIAEKQGLTREQVIAQLAAAGFEVDSGVEGQGPNYTDITRITESGSGDLVVSHETGPDGTQTSRVIDNDGNETRRTENTDGSTTNVLIESDGRVTETVVDTDGKTTTTVTYEQNGVTVEEVTIDDGKTTTTIIDDDGNRTELDPEQDTSREGIDEIAEAVSEGKSIDSIAEEMGLDPAQIIAQLAAAGFEVSEYTEPDDSVTRRIVDADSGEEIARYRFTMGEVTQSTFFVDAQGNEVQRTEYRNGRSIETVVEANGRRTVTSESTDGEKTVSVTHNGYTVTTPPEGDITVRREEDGTEVEVEKGTPLEAMVETLMAVDLDSSDAEEARAAEVVLTAVERALAGERFQELYGSDGTDGAVAEQQKALDEAIEEYGPGQQPDRNVTYENPYGDPPLEPPPSGGDWVPMDGLWMDPEVAKATVALKVLEAEQLKAFAEFERSQKQLNVFAIDPAYEEALQRAGNLFDEALAPQGLVWVRPEPEGTLEEARAQLEGAETRQEAAGEAMEEYQEAERLLDEAISAQGEMPDAPNGYVCTSDDTPADLQQNADQYEQEQSAYEAAQADVDVLFSEVRLHSAKGDSHLTDYQVSQLEAELAEADPDSDAYGMVEEELEKARTSQEGADIQVDTAQGYYDFHAARRDNLQLTVEAYDMREQLLEAFNEDKGLLEEGKKFNTIGGDYLGEFTGQQIIEEREDGLWVVTHFEEGTTEELLAPEELSEWWENNRDPELTEAWLELGETRQSAHDREREEGTDLHRALERNYDFALESIDEQVSDLEAELDSLFKTHGQGTEEAPEELFSGDIEPQEIEPGGQELLVTPEVAAAFEELGLEALKSSDHPVGVTIEGERRWVHAEIAITHVALAVARDETQREMLETARDEVSNTADRYELGTEQSMPLLGESEADYAARVEYDIVAMQGDNAVDTLFQSRFQEFHAAGFDTTFRTFDEKGLDKFVEDNLGLTDGREEYDDVLDAIHDVGGERPAMRAVPLLHLDREGGRSEIVLLAVRGDDGEVRYVDGTGRYYADLAAFQDQNRLFGEEGRLVVPKDLEMRPGEDGDIPLEVVTARNVSVQEKIVDPLIGIGTGVATVLSFTPAAPVAAPLALLGSGYLGYRAFEHQRSHMQHGGDWNDLESFMNYLSIATTALPVAGSGLRTIGMARSLNVTKGEAFLASIGAVKPGSTLAANANTYMRSADGFNRWARRADWGAITTGVPLMGYSGYQLAVNGDQMTGLQQIDAVLGLSTGFVGTGLGIYGLRTTRPPRGNGSNPPAEPGGQPPAGRGGDTPPPTSDTYIDAPDAPGSTAYRPDVNEPEGARNTPAQEEPGSGIPSEEAAHDTPRLPDPAFREEASQTVATAIEGRAEQAALFDSQAEAAPSTTRRDNFDSEASTQPAREAITFRLQDEQGRAIEARVLGPRAPSSVDNVYIQPAIGPRPRGDEQGVSSKTHRLLQDPKSGESVVIPWVRGGAEALQRQPGDNRLASLIYEYDERGFWVHGRNDSDVDLKVLLIDASGEVGKGPVNADTVMVTHYDRGDMPPGSGSLMLADLLRVYEVRPGRLVFEDVIEANTRSTYDMGGDPGDTVLGRSGRRVLQELGLEATAYRFEEGAYGAPNLIIEIAPSIFEVRSVGRGETLLDVTLRQLGERGAGLATPRTVYRLDSRGPNIVFAEGFSPRFGSWNKKYSELRDAVEAHLWADDSVFVSTSSDLSVPKGAGQGNEWVYVIAEPGNGLDVDGYLGSHEWEGVSEVLFDFIPSERILGARRLGEEGALRPRSKSEGDNEPTWAPLYTGEFVRNPHFIAEAAASATPRAGTERDTMSQPATRPAREAITFRLQDEQGRPIEARVLGPSAPSSVDSVYIQPAIGPRPRGDEPGVMGKTHIFYRDPETGEAFVMPWIRGASQNHVPSAQQTTTPPQGLARLYRLSDLDALNQASTDGTLPAGHYVHIIRSSNTGLDNATFFIDGGTVPKSGRIDENGHIRWPSSQKGQPVTLTLHDQGNGQQTVRVEDNTGNETPREVTAKHGDVYVVVTSDRATETRAQIQGGGLPFAAYSGNGFWSVSSTVSTSQPSTSAPNATLTAQQQGTTPPQATPATQQNAAPTPLTSVSGRVSVTTDSQGSVVRIHDLGGNWSSVRGQSSRKVWRSPYDSKARNDTPPETTLVRRSVLEQALAPEDVAKLPNDPYVRVSLGEGSQESDQAQTASVHATRNDGSPVRRRTARGLAAAMVGGSMFAMHSASSHGWTGDVFNRAAAPASPAFLLNGLGFVTRGSMIFFKSRFDEKIRINREALERGEVTAERLNWEASRIIASRRALNLSKEQVARVGTVTEEFWARYQLLQELPVTQESRQRGWTEDAKSQALIQASSLYRAQLKKVAGKEALTINPLDPRTVRGMIFNSSILTTHLVNDVVSWQFIQNKVSDGEFLRISNNLMDFTGDLGIAGFLVANVVLAGSAAAKVGTGLARVDLKSLPWVNKLAGTGTAVGSYFYGIMTPPWAAYTMYAAGEAMANGHWYTAGVNLAALPFQVALSYYGIRGLRDDTISMVKSWKEGQDPGRSWPIRVLYPMTTIPMAALTGTEAYNQFAQGNHVAGTALAGGTLMQTYFIDLASRRLNWTDADVRHGPFRRLAGDNRLAADESRIWAGVGLTLTGSMLIPGALIDLRNYLEDKDLLPDWDWLVADVADLEGEEEPNETPVDLTDYLRDNELLPGWVWRLADSEGKKEANEAPDTKVSLGRTEQEGGSPSLEPTPRANPALEEQGHDWVEAASHLSLGGIAIKRGHDIAELVELNLSHIGDPTALRPGDRVYLPKRELA